jgi:hypothetical protein
MLKLCTNIYRKATAVLCSKSAIRAFSFYKGLSLTVFLVGQLDSNITSNFYYYFDYRGFYGYGTSQLITQNHGNYANVCMVTLIPNAVYACDAHPGVCCTRAPERTDDKANTPSDGQILCQSVDELWCCRQAWEECSRTAASRLCAERRT